MTLYNYHTLSIGLELMKYYDQVTNSCRLFCPFLKKIYYRARVLQRSTTSTAPLNFNSLKFEIGFNLAVIWMLVFVALGKGNLTFDLFGLIRLMLFKCSSV